MIKIAVCLVTYNQENYIAQAIESVLMQKSEFQIDIIIGEDSSTDNTFDICKMYHEKYPNKIKLISNSKNLGLVSNTINLFRYILDNEYTYTAMLDGDDYWIDEYKIQKQVIYLEKNPDYGLIHSNISVLNQKKQNIEVWIRTDVPTGNVFEQLRKSSLANCTVLFKTKFLNKLNFVELESLNLLSCDFITNVIISRYTKVAFLEDVTAVWRRGISSVSSSHQIDKQFAYIEHEIRSSKYLGSLFPIEYHFPDKDANWFRSYRKLEIAFALHSDYALVKDIMRTYEPLYINEYEFFASNYFLFKLFFIRKFMYTVYNKLKSLVK